MPISFGLRNYTESAHTDAAQSHLKSASVFFEVDNMKTILIAAAAAGNFS